MRQYKGMQEELIMDLKERESTIQELKDEIQTVKTQHAIQIEKKHAARNRDMEIATCKQK